MQIIAVFQDRSEDLAFQSLQNRLQALKNADIKYSKVKNLTEIKIMQSRAERETKS